MGSTLKALLTEKGKDSSAAAASLLPWDNIADGQGDSSDEGLQEILDALEGALNTLLAH